VQSWVAPDIGRGIYLFFNPKQAPAFAELKTKLLSLLS
jgi:hypothetical protein